MKDFSMFEHALEIGGSSVEDIGQVSNISRRIFNEQVTFRFRSQGSCLEYVSLLIENALLLRTNRAGRIYAGFEQLSRMEGIVDRYLRIADISERLYVFGEADWKPPRHPNMRLITLAHDAKLAREWFIIADSPTLRVALIAIDESGSNVPALETRNFRAFKSSNPAVIAHLVAAIEGLIDASLAA